MAKADKWLENDGGEEDPQPTRYMMEKHYTLTELTTAWHFSERMLKEIFAKEPGVIIHTKGRLRRGTKRLYTSYRIPQSVARRVYLRLNRGAGKADSSQAASAPEPEEGAA